MWACRHWFGAAARIECHLLDYEATWRRHGKVLAPLFAPQVTVAFERCDVTLPLAAGDNAAAAALTPGTRLFIFAYVCNETSLADAAAGFAF